MRTTNQIIYDNFDGLIDQCEEATLKTHAQKLRDLRDTIPDDNPEEEPKNEEN